MRLLVKQYKILVVLLAALLCLCLSGEAVFNAGSSKVFVIKSKDVPSYNQAINGFRQQAPPEWVIVEYDLEGTLKNTDKLAKRLREEKPKLVVAVGAKALAAVTQLRVSYPAIFCTAINISTSDLEKLNITGISLTVSPKDQLEILTSLSPKIKKIGVLLRKQESSELLQNVMSIAGKHKVEIVLVKLESEKEIPRKIRAALKEVDALWMLDDSYILSKESLDFVILNTIENNLPFMAISEAFVKEGALLSLSPSFFDNGKQAAQLAGKILTENSSPKNIPIAFHQKPNLVINLKIAKKINMAVPTKLLDKAKKTYE